jgi:hypothetical protein
MHQAQVDGATQPRCFHGRLHAYVPVKQLCLEWSCDEQTKLQQAMSTALLLAAAAAAQ